MATDGEIVDTEDVSVAEVMELYFSVRPPFSKDKKEEFPDAVALISLNKWSDEGKRGLLLVSTDNDWENFAKEFGEGRLYVCKELSTALQLLNEARPHHEQTTKVRLAKLLEAQESGRLAATIRRSTSDTIREKAIVLAESPLRFTYRIDSVRIDGMEISKKIRSGIMRSDAVAMVSFAEIDVQAVVWVDFTFFGKEGDEPIGTSSQGLQTSVPVMVLATVKDEISVSVLQRPTLELDFGPIGPDSAA